MHGIRSAQDEVTATCSGVDEAFIIETLAKSTESKRDAISIAMREPAWHQRRKQLFSKPAWGSDRLLEKPSGILVRTLSHGVFATHPDMPADNSDATNRTEGVVLCAHWHTQL